LVCAELVQNGIIISACKIIVPSLLLRYFSFFYQLGNFKVNLGIFRTESWEFQKSRVAALVTVAKL